jgi:outer membrane protein assembly factor BamD
LAFTPSSASPVRTLLAALALGAVLAGCGASIVPQIHNESDRLEVARRLYARHEYTLVVEVLNNYATTGTGHADIDQAVYLLGLAYLNQKEFASAQGQFERIAHDYPESDSANAASYRLGEALFGQARDADFDQEFTLRAMAQWDGFVKGTPADPWAPLARQRIADCRTRLARKLWRSGDVYLKLNLYEPAKIYFTSVLGDYADTPVVGDALIGLAVADARLGRKDTALVVLRGLEQEFAGRPLGVRAAATRARVEKWPAEGDTKHRRHRTVESTAPPAGTASPTPATSTPYTP